MFGDLGHGFLLTLIGGYMVYNQKSLAKQDLGEVVH
jgi:vacuolar-type H+-ATPase subunit I/STV1